MSKFRTLEIELDPSKVLAVIVYKRKDAEVDDVELDVDIDTVVPDEELAGLLALTALDLRSRSEGPDTEVTGFQLRDDPDE